MARTKAKPIPKRDTGVSDAANELELSENTVRRDLRRGAPHSRRGKVIYLNVPEYRAWRADQGLTGERGRPVEVNSPDLEAARLRKENALASKYELQVAREKGQLVDKAAYRSAWLSEVQTIKGKLLGLGASVAPACYGQDAGEIQRLIDERIQQVFRELASL